MVSITVSISLFGGLIVALVSPFAWLTDGGFVLANLLTAGWFVVRAVSVWVLPHFSHGSLAPFPVAQVQIEVAPNGNRP